RPPSDIARRSGDLRYTLSYGAVRTVVRLQHHVLLPRIPTYELADLAQVVEHGLAGGRVVGQGDDDGVRHFHALIDFHLDGGHVLGPAIVQLLDVLGRCGPPVEERAPPRALGQPGLGLRLVAPGQ